MALGPPLLQLHEIDSPFQLTEHLKSLHNAALHRDSSTTISPIDRPTATRLAQPPEGVDKYLWLYELCRLLCKETNAIIVALFSDDPPCSAQTCTEMRASEWQYLCAVHDPPKPCCAIDYCCHTLDWTNHVLTSQKNFPSRLALGDAGAGGSGGGHSQLRQLTNIFRRVYRIFAHAWFQHRDMYWKVELKSGLYVFFKTVCDVYNLIPEDNYTVPPEAEGIEPPKEQSPKQGGKPPLIMKRQEDNSGMDHEQTEGEKHPHLRAPTADASTTRRHKHTPSVGSESITTVLEDPEEDDDEKMSGMEETVILSSEPPEYSAEPGPVIENLAAAEDPAPLQTQRVVTAIADVPAISVDDEPAATTSEAAAKDAEQTRGGPADSTEVDVKEEAGEDGAGETVASSAASDASTDSWQMLTDEEKQSSRVGSKDGEDLEEAATPVSPTMEQEADAHVEKKMEEPVGGAANKEDSKASTEDADSSPGDKEMAAKEKEGTESQIPSQTGTANAVSATDDAEKETGGAEKRTEEKASKDEAKEVETLTREDAKDEANPEASSPVEETKATDESKSGKEDGKEQAKEKAS